MATAHGDQAQEEDDDEAGLAERLLAEWDGGRGTSKREIERQEWGDGAAHGWRFDRFIFRRLGIRTTKCSFPS